MRCLRAVAIALLLTGCASTGTGAPDVRYLVETADYVVRAEARVSSLWPGFWEGRRAFLVYHPDRAVLLVADGPAPAGFTTLEAVPGSLRGRAHLAAGRLRGLDGNIDFAFRIDPLEVTAVPYLGSPAATLKLLYHEAFHQTQLARFRESALPGRVDVQATARPEFLAAFEAERRLLLEALDAAYPVRPGGRSAPDSIGPPRRDAVRRLAQEYLAVRAGRAADLGEPAAAFERYYERMEGTAAQVGLEAALVALGRDRAETAVVLQRTYLAEVTATQPRPGDAGLLRLRAYGTGAAIGLLLDSLAVPWREAVESGVPLDHLLSEAVGFGALDAEGRDRLARRALARAAGRPAPDRPAATSPTLAHRPDDQERVRVDLVIPVPPGGRRPRVAINAPDFMGYIGGAIDGPSEVVDLGSPTLMSVIGDGLFLVARGHQAWLDGRDPAQVIVRVHLPDWPTVNGIDPRALPAWLEGPVLLKGADFEARLDEGGSVTAQSDGLVVRVGRR